jgi:hypothetical protein
VRPQVSLFPVPPILLQMLALVQFGPARKRRTPARRLVTITPTSA